MRSTFLLAQNLGEYSGVGSSVSEGLSRLRNVLEQQIRDMSPTGWALIGGALLVVWLIFRFRR